MDLRTCALVHLKPPGVSSQGRCSVRRHSATGLGSPSGAPASAANSAHGLATIVSAEPVEATAASAGRRFPVEGSPGRAIAMLRNSAEPISLTGVEHIAHIVLLMTRPASSSNGDAKLHSSSLTQVSACVHPASLKLAA